MTFLDRFARKLGVLEYLGAWDASSGPPAIAQRGGYYVVSVAGSTNLDGITDWNPGDWAIWNGSAWEQIDNSELVRSVAGRTGEITLSHQDVTDFDAAAFSVVEPVFSIQKEPTGFPNQTDSVLSFNEATRTLSLAPAVSSFDVWHQGVKSTISTTLTKQIPDVSGSYFFYVTAAGVLDYSTTFSTAILNTHCYTAYVYWNATDGKATSYGEERHGVSMDGVTHGYLHTTRGTQLVSGAAVTFTTAGDGTSNADAQIGLSDMQLRDEDILAVIAHSDAPSAKWQQKLFPVAYLPVYYRSGGYWTKNTGTAYPLKTGASRAYYNKNTGGTWSLQEASADGKFVVSYIFGTTNMSEPVLALMGQDEYTDLNDAKARAAWSKVDFGDLPAQEMKLLYIVFFQTSSAYTNAPKAVIKAVTDLRYGGDREVNAISSATDHGNLSGLGDDDHQQYILVSGSRAMGGDLDLGSYKISNVTTVNNVTVEAHASRHLPNGADPITTAAPISVGTSNSSGTANSLARSDHQHALPAVGTAGTYGSSSTIPVITTDTYGRVTSVTNTPLSISHYEATATAQATTTSLTDTLLTSMTLTPAAGTYLAVFSGSMVNSANGAQRLWVSIYAAGVQDTGSERVVGVGGGAYASVQTQAVVTVNGSQAVEVKWRAAAGTNTAQARSLTLIKLG